MQESPAPKRSPSVDANANEIDDKAEEAISRLPACRICLEGERQGSARLQRFCRCRGTMALCHHDCLVTWVRQEAASECELCLGPFDVTSAVEPFCKWRIPPTDWITTIDTGFCCLCFFLGLLLLALQYIILVYDISERPPEEPFLAIHFQLLTMLAISTILFCEEFVAVVVPQWRALRAANTVLTIHARPTSLHDVQKKELSGKWLKQEQQSTQQ